MITERQLPKEKKFIIQLDEGIFYMGINPELNEVEMTDKKEEAYTVFKFKDFNAIVASLRKERKFFNAKIVQL